MDRRLEHHLRRFRRKGDPRALGRVFDLSSRELAMIARQLVRDAATAEDIVQATYLTVIEKVHGFDGRQRVMPWLIGILARHAARARVAAARTPDPERVAEPTASNPARDAQLSELGTLIEERIAELPPDYAEAVRPYLAEGQCPREIAQTLGITPNAVSVRVHRGLALLRRGLPRSAAPAIVVAMPNLALVRENVLASLTTSAAAPTAFVAAGTAGIITMKKSIILVASGALLGSGATHLLSPDVARTASRAVETVAASPNLVDVDGALPLSVLDAAEPSRFALTADAPSRADSGAPRTADGWLARILACKDVDAASEVFREIAALDPAEGLSVMESIWARVPDEAFRLGGLSVFLREGHERTPAILHLGATDENVLVQGTALQEASTITLRRLAVSFDAYLVWHASFGDQTLRAVLLAAAVDFGKRSASASDAELIALFRRFDHPPLALADAAGVDLRAALVEADVQSALLRLVESEDEDAQRTATRWAHDLGLDCAMLSALEAWLRTAEVARQVTALHWMGNLEPDEEFLRENVLPIVTNWASRDVVIVDAAVQLLGRSGNDFAVDALLDVLLNPSPRTGTSRFFNAAWALGRIGDARAIPTMIAVIRSDDTHDSIYWVGHFGLKPLTGVPYDEHQRGAFWVEWWSANRDRLPGSVGGMSIPFVSFGD